MRKQKTNHDVKTLHRKISIDQRDTQRTPGVNSDAPKA